MVRLEQLSSLLIKFPVYHVTSNQVIWINKKWDEYCDNQNFKNSFCKRFSYIAKDYAFHDSMELDKNSVKFAMTDCYGGKGVGMNAGGGRTGIVDGYQLKGIGRTYLVGENGDEMHSYGGQSFNSAIYEVINTIVFDHILPIGTISCFGLIYTGSQSSRERDFSAGTIIPSPGAMTVREVCLRPAHFLRAPRFIPRQECIPYLPSDVERTRQANKQLRDLFSDHNGIVRFLGTFLYNCACQLAFARVFRIAHGALSPSNIAFDGRWLDMTHVGFLDSGVNYKLNDVVALAFDDEQDIILSYLNEFLYTYSKYIGRYYNIQPLLEYYKNTFDAFFSENVIELIGLNPSWVEDKEVSKKLQSLVLEVKGLINSNEKYTTKRPVGPHAQDGIGQFLTNIFKSLSRRDDPQLSDFFLNAYNFSKPDCSYVNFLVSSAIKSLKKSFFTSFFTYGRILPRLKILIPQEEPAFFEDYIDTHLDVAKWLFQSDDSANNFLFRSKGVSIRFIVKKGHYAVRCSGFESVFESASDLGRWILSQPDEELAIDDHSFREALLQLINILEMIESHYLAFARTTI